VTRTLEYQGHTWLIEATGVSSHADGRSRLGLWFGHAAERERLLGGVQGEALDDVSDEDLTRALAQAIGDRAARRRGE